MVLLFPIHKLLTGKNVVDTISLKLQEMRCQKQELKEQLWKLTLEMESLKSCQSAMVSWEVESLTELDHVEALAKAVAHYSTCL